MRTLNLLVATLGDTLPGGLQHLPPHRLITSSATPWGAAANGLIDWALRLGGDALFCDDDVTFMPDSLAHLDMDRADAFGLDLHTLDGARQVGARHTWDGANLIDWVQPGPAYVAHVSTSAIYLTERALQSGARFPEWPGVHWEDVAYCFDLWLHGCRVMAVPGRVDHAITGGAGATKRHTPEFWQKWQHNRAAFQAWCGGRDLARAPRGAITSQWDVPTVGVPVAKIRGAIE